jgi:predicted MFS family arabinose efflux permease
VGLLAVSIPLLTLHYTHSAFLIALVTALGRAPGLLVAVPFGAVVDRFNRRKVLFRLEIVRCALAAGFAACVATGAVDLALIYVVTFLLGSFDVAYDCAVSASVPSTVSEPGALVRANARLQTASLVGEEMVGQAVGGVAFSAARALPFVGNAATFLVSASLLPGAVPDSEPRANRGSFFADIRQGAEWVWRNPVMRTLTALVTQLAFCQMMVLGVLVLYATADLHLSKAGYGYLLGLAACGSIVGAFAAERLHRRLGTGRCIIGAGLVAAATYPILAATSSKVVACVALALESAAVLVGVIAAQSLRQTVVPDEYQGRAASTYLAVILGAYPLGSGLGGLLADSVGVRGTFYAAGGLQLVLLVLTGPRFLRRLRQRAAQ